MKQPWELNPALTQTRLQAIASLIRDVRDEVIDRHDDELGDSARGTGLRAYECCRTRICRASIDSEKHPWLSVITGDGKFTFSIDSVPIRFYRGNPSTPEERRLMPSIEASRQMSLLTSDIGDIARICWFFAVEVDELKYVEHVTFVGFNDSELISHWEIPLYEKVRTLNSIDTDLPQPIEVQKASVSIKDKKQKQKYSE